MTNPPDFDENGLNVFDPNDTLGHKSDYITQLQEIAILRHLPKGDGEVALDLGCGYGRLTPLLQKLGWYAVGIDPSKDLIEYARHHFPEPQYMLGQLPDLPMEPKGANLVLMQNILRRLKLGGSLNVVQGIGQYVAEGGHIVVVDNIRDNHPDYLPERDIIKLIEKEQFSLVKRIPIRAARWWLIYAIRYGLVPRKYFKTIARWELSRMAGRSSRPVFQYYNVMFIFRKQPVSDTEQGQPHPLQAEQSFPLAEP